MKNYVNMTLGELTKEYNKMTGENKKFESIEQAKGYISAVLDTPAPEPKKTFSPKQLEEELHLPAITIRKKLRKLFPEMAKKGTWKITEDMIKTLKEVK